MEPGSTGATCNNIVAAPATAFTALPHPFKQRLVGFSRSRNKRTHPIAEHLAQVSKRRNFHELCTPVVVNKHACPEIDMIRRPFCFRRENLVADRERHREK